MPGERKTKIVAQRIDLSYPNRPSPMRSLRRLLVIACAVIALAWCGWALWARSELLYNPGPVAASHAMFENNCAVCHDGGDHGAGGAGGARGGKFFKTVSDAACLKCHDGSIHSEMQVSLASVTGGKPLMSSNCITCHVEHKGHDALAGASDLLCTRCHDKLGASVAGGKTDLQAGVKTFGAPPAHPTFGRALKQGGQGGRWVDPTPLKFNHKKHLSEINPTVGDCSSCHQQSASGDRHIMQPVSFEANCKSCHPLTLAAGLPDLPHEQMSIVRLFSSGVPLLFGQKLAMMTPEEKDKALTITTEKKVGLRMVKETKKVTEAQWLEAQIKDLFDKKVANSPAANQPAYKAIEALEPAAKNAAALELYAAYGMTPSCSYCHTVTGVPAAVAKFPSDLLHTLPTGYAPQRKPPTTAPVSMPTTRPRATPEGRRWFTASVFAHDSHRSMSCIDCHGQAKGSTLTSDVLLPDLQTCVTCHHTGGRDNLAASSNCVTCHVYHDRGREQPMKGRSVEELLGRAKPLAAR